MINISTWTEELSAEVRPGLPLCLALLLRLLSPLARLPIITATTATNNKVTLWPLMLPALHHNDEM